MRLHPSRFGGVPHRRRFGFIGLFGALVLLALIPGGAKADPVADKQAEAQQISDQLTALEQKLIDLDAEQGGAMARVDEANAAIAAASGKVDAARNEFETKQAQVRQYAIQAYVTGKDSRAFDALITSDGADGARKSSYLQAAGRLQSDVLGELDGTHQRFDAEMAELTRVKDEADAHVADMNRARAEATDALAEQRRVQASVSKELNGLVQQAQGREAAARQAKVSQQSGQLGGGTGPAPSGSAGAAVAAAKRALGVPYVSAGEDMSGFDCSGLTQWAWAQAGRALPRTTYDQWNAGTHVAMSAIQPGDLIFYNGRGHVALYVGNGQMIHAPHTGLTVKYDAVNYWGPIDGAVRP
jgi:cell wall-associated NlpC family hydrolase